MKNWLLCILLLLAVAVVSCSKEEYLVGRPEVSRGGDDAMTVCEKLNENSKFMAFVARAYLECGEVTVFHPSEYRDGSSASLILKYDGNVVKYYDIDYTQDSCVPVVLLEDCAGELHWNINGQSLEQKTALQLSGKDVKYPLFECVGGVWLYSMGDDLWEEVGCAETTIKPCEIELSPQKDFLVCTFREDCQLLVATYELRNTLKPYVRNKGFYKDVFMDAGVYLTTRQTLPVVSYLGYSMDFISCARVADTGFQNTVIAGDSNDLNGRLLYPDGAPRYRLLYVCGGKASKHGQSMRPECLENMRQFVNNGGSYVGTCAGAFFASYSYDNYLNPYYLRIWPGKMQRTGLSGIRTGMFVDRTSPLLNYYDFGGDHYVANIRHNGGGYAGTWPAGTELLARYDYEDDSIVHMKPSAWAYKDNMKSGRVVLEGSHPEEVSSGERRDFTAAMFRYAIDGNGKTVTKGVLRRGEPRVMDRSTDDNLPEYTMIGDMQYHHFVVYIPNKAYNISFTLSSEYDCDMQLTLSPSTYAYSEDAEYATSATGANHNLAFEDLNPGMWYVAVRCLTTVNSTDNELGQAYTGRVDVLNGVPYTITVDWEVDM